VNIKPSGQLVLVRVDKAPEKSSGGIVLPQDVRERDARTSVRGTLAAVGPKAWQNPVDEGVPRAQVGDTVLFAKYAGVEVDADSADVFYRLMTDEDILGTDNQTE